MERKQLQEPLEMHRSPLNFLQRAVGFVFFLALSKERMGGQIGCIPSNFPKIRGCVSLSSVF